MTPLATPGTEIEIRLLRSLADFQTCVALGLDVWGAAYGDTVPASMFLAIVESGGLVAGAFSPDGEMVGFVTSLVGVRHDVLIHWSHVLAVRPTARNAGVGYLLKQFQREELARRGVEQMFWTFDPLLAPNAHLNLNRLGSRVVEYIRNLYGVTASPLHLGLETDRLVIECPTRGPARAPSSLTRSATPLPVLTPCPRPGDVPRTGDPAAMLIEIPTDLSQAMAEHPTHAVTWRLAVREHFEWALHHGYAVTGVRRDVVTNRTFYVIEAAPETAP